MTKFEEKKKEAYEKASMKYFGNADGSIAMRYLLNELENAGLLKEQQALPVVPEYVGEWIDKNILVAHNAELMIHNILICAIDNKNRYLFPLEVEKFVLKNPITFLNAVITGEYEVEKPQLFYLKSKSLLENEGESEESDVDELYLNAKGNLVIYKGDAKKFTQQEIDSMQTGSYEQIEVEK